MIRPDRFNGPLGAVMADFIACKRMQGYTYQAQTDNLRLFDRFITERDCPGGVLQGDVFGRYQASVAALTPGTQEGYLSVVRVFSRYLHALRPESAIMPVNMEPRHTRSVRFYRIAPEQIRELMEAAPGLHDLRHNFACGCIARWREAGEDVQALLPVLVNAMGHVSMFSTQFYVHLDAAELQPASVRFKKYFCQNNSK